MDQVACRARAALSKDEGRGWPPIGLARMLRMYVLQQCFGVSDEGMEDAVCDSLAIRRFISIG